MMPLGDVSAPAVVRAPIAPEDEPLLARALAGGGAMAYPTETSYALGGNALCEELAERIFRLKGRPPAKALPLLIDPSAGMDRYFSAPSLTAERLMRAFWPGALTLVLPASPKLPRHLADGRGTVAVRWSSGAVVARLLALGGVPLIGTSANRSGARPGTSPAEVLADFGGALEVAIDGGPAPGGPSSTLLDLSGEFPRLLREGAISAARLRAVLPGVALEGPPPEPPCDG